MRLLLIGAPGAGKGTQAVELARHFGLAHISSGDLLRQHIREGTSIGRAAKGYVEAGDASIKKVAKSAAAGAIIGGIAGDAGDGAAIGAGVAVLRKGQSITIPPGTMLEFKLAQPFTVQTP